MLTTKPTSQMIKKWKETFEEYHSSLSANRKTGSEIIKYFESKYPFLEIEDSNFKKAVELNILENKYYRNQLPDGVEPQIKCYCVGEVLVGIDVVSGEFYIECEDMEKAIPIYDDLFVYRGLSEEDLKNYFLVAQYVDLISGEYGFKVNSCRRERC